MRTWLVGLRGNQSQDKLAKKIGVAQSTYAAIETGNRNPSVETAKKIASVMGFDWTRFFDEVVPVEQGKDGA